MWHHTRRLLVPTAVVALLAAGLSAPAAADRGGPDRPGFEGPGSLAASAAVASRSERATQALAKVQRIFAHSTRQVGETGREATLALRDLRQLYPALSPADKAKADRFLARPTEGAGDPAGDGYLVPEATPVCGTDVCVHYVTSTSDQVPLADGPDTGTVPDYVDLALATMEDVHQAYVGAGYRAPKPDGTLGNNALTDIYLADVGPGLYGYCTSDQPYVPGVYDVWAYCVLDNDYDPVQFTTNTPTENLQVTAAHEYFHAVQFGYDAAEDGWFMEATATWAEDELYDGVDDNVQYLPAGQLGNPYNPLDAFYGAIHYGNWVFVRYLTERFPAEAGGLPVLVRTMWRKADAAPGAQDLYSTQAIKSALATQNLTFTNAFARFSAVNRFSRKFYDEGTANAYPIAPVYSWTTLSPRKRGHTESGTLGYQLSSVSFGAKPKNFKGTWKLKVSVDMSASTHGPAVVVDQVKPSGAHAFRLVKLNGKGVGSLRVPFTNAKTTKVVITLVSAGIHYNCWQGTIFACSGDPLDDNLAVAMKITAVR